MRKNERSKTDEDDAALLPPPLKQAEIMQAFREYQEGTLVKHKGTMVN